MTLKDISDVFVIVAGSIAAGALVLQLCSLRQQQKLQDFSAFNTLSNELRELWQGFTEIPHADTYRRRFYFGELINKYEAMCFMFNNRILGSRVEVLLKQHIIEVMLMWLTDDDIRSMITSLQSGSETFIEISRFIKKHEGAYQAQWEFLLNSPLLQNAV